MKTQQVLDYLNRKPFRPFATNLDDGEAILIDVPRALLTTERKPELLIAFTEDGRMHLFEESVISSLEELKTGEATKQ